MKKKLGAILCAALISSACIATPAFAATATPTVDSNSGAGTSDMMVKIQDTTERGGTMYSDQTKDYYNPDRGDGYGKNIAFSVPTRITFVIDSTGTLQAPSPSACYIENNGSQKIHASSLLATPASGWHIVNDANASDLTGETTSTQNNVSIQINPSTNISNTVGKISLHNYTSKNTLPETTTWNMTSGVNSTSVLTDRVQMNITGNFSRVMDDLTASTGAKFCTLTWYMTNGSNA